jgi:hypothetical protein
VRGSDVLVLAFQQTPYPPSTTRHLHGCLVVLSAEKTPTKGVWTCSDGAEWHRARPDTLRGCLFVLSAVLRPSSMTRHLHRCLVVLGAVLHHPSTSRHPSWVSFRARRCPGPWRPSSTTRHPSWVSFRARRHPAPFEHNQTPYMDVLSCSAPSCNLRARPDTYMGVLLCSVPSCTLRAHPDTLCGCLFVLGAVLQPSSTTRHLHGCLVVLGAVLHPPNMTRHPSWISFRARCCPAPFEHNFGRIIFHLYIFYDWGSFLSLDDLYFFSFLGLSFFVLDYFGWLCWL